VRNNVEKLTTETRCRKMFDEITSWWKNIVMKFPRLPWPFIFMPKVVKRKSGGKNIARLRCALQRRVDCVCVKWIQGSPWSNVWRRGFYASANESVKAFLVTRSDNKLYTRTRHMQASGDTFVINSMDNRCSYQLCAMYKSYMTAFLFILFPCSYLSIIWR